MGMEATQNTLRPRPGLRRRYVEATKRDGTSVVGWCYDDGLSSLTSVTCLDGETRYLSALDSVSVYRIHPDDIAVRPRFA